MASDPRKTVGVGNVKVAVVKGDLCSEKVINVLHAGDILVIFCRVLIFFSKLTVSKSFYRIIIRVVNSLEPVKQATTERTCLKGPLKGNSHAHHSYVEKQEKMPRPCLSDHLRFRINTVFRYSYVSGYFHIFLTDESK